MSDTDSRADAMTVASNSKAWMADMHMAVQSEARATGESEIAIAARHVQRLLVKPLQSALPLEAWAEYVAWRTGHLAPKRAARWKRACG